METILVLAACEVVVLTKAILFVTFLGGLASKRGDGPQSPQP